MAVGIQERFDELAKALATNRLSRRQVLKVFAGGAMGVLAAQLGIGGVGSTRAGAQTADCSIRNYDTTGTRFTGDPIRADSQFFDSLDAINQCAEDNDVNVRVTSSYRRPADPVGNAVVRPAQRSNHHAGHAIDMNVEYTDATGATRLCNSRCLHLDNLPNAPQQVQSFIQCVRDDPGLRWGGDFRDNPNTARDERDPVHIDDHLNADYTAWRRRVNAAWCPDGSTCVNGTCCPNARVCRQGTICCRAGRVCRAGVCVAENCGPNRVTCTADRPTCCGGRCRPPCPAGQTRNADCQCESEDTNCGPNHSNCWANGMKCCGGICRGACNPADMTLNPVTCVCEYTPCKPSGATCTGGYQCCTGTCACSGVCTCQ